MQRILIVDDRPVNRQFLTTLLRFKGYETRESGDGIEALAETIVWHPDLAIVDVHMPRMTGDQFVEELRKSADASLASMPVIFYTATYKETDARKIARACGVDLVLTKPADPETILSTVEKALGSSPLFAKAHDPEELHDLHARLATLTELSIDLATDHDRDIVLRKMTRAARKITSADRIVACVFDGDGMHYATAGYPDTEAGPSPEEIGAFCAPGPAGQTVRRMSFQDGGTRHALSIPMTFSSPSRGVLLLIGRPAAPPLTEDEAALALTLTTHACVTYDNVILYESLAEAQRVLERRVEERTAELKIERDRLALLSDELADLNRELESFSYSVSHDLRAPLRSITGFADLLIDDRGLDERSRDHLGRVRTAACQMGHLIDDLLTLSRCARSPISKQRIDLSALARDIVRDLRETCTGRSADVSIDEEILVSADLTLLRVILTNLLSNAWKFTGKRELARIEVQRCSNPDGDAFVVRDNGAGFDMQSAEKLFAPFQRLHSRGEFEGTGIGLATVQRLVHRHGGRIWAEAHPERGAAFYVALPRDSSANAEVLAAS